MAKAKATSKTTEKSTRQAKIVFIGDAGVGKSSLVLRFVQNNWTPHLTSTIGAAFSTKTVRYDSDVVRWELWDTAGQEQYNSLVPMYYRGAVGAVLVYDITSQTSFNRLQKWVVELRNCGPANLVIVVCGNKADLHEHRQVDTKHADDYVKHIRDMPATNTTTNSTTNSNANANANSNSGAGGAPAIFLETSAKNALNVDQVFYQLWKALPKPMDENLDDDIAAAGAGAGAVRDLNQPPPPKGGCC